MAVILFMDEDEGICEYCREELTAFGHTVRATGTEQEVLEEILMLRPDLLVLDMKVPSRNRIEFLNCLSLLHPDIPVIVHTVYESLRHHPQIDPEYFVMKSPHLKELHRIIDRVLCMRLQPVCSS